MKPAARLLSAVALIAACVSTVQTAKAAYDLEAQARALDAAAASRNATVVSERIAASYAAFAGSASNATSLVKGMRSGKVIALRSQRPEGPSEMVAFNASTGPMQWGDVHAGLALAQASLTRAGITQPSAAQIQVALLGGVITHEERTLEHDGVLKMRHLGMPWDRIAQAAGARPTAVAATLARTQDQVAALPMEVRIEPAPAVAESQALPRGEPGAPIYLMSVSTNAALATEERTPSAWGRYRPTERATRTFESLPGIK